MNHETANIHDLARRNFLIKWGRRAACLALLGAIGFAGLRGYGSWRRHNLARQTQAFIAAGDFRNAVLVARRLLTLDQNDLVACRAMAEMAEKARSVEAITWRRKLAQLTPGDISNQLALARTALRFQDGSTAHAVLKALPENARETVEYHQVAAAEALMQRQMARAESHFATAQKMAPDDPQLAFNLAAIQLASADASVSDEARTTLAALTQNSAVRREALRALAADAITRNDRNTARRWATELRNEAGGPFSDALLYFEAVSGTDAAAPVLEELQKEAAATPASTAEFITWLNRHSLAQVALHWSTTLPTEIASAQPVPLAVAESFSMQQDWNGLRAHVSGKNWGAVESLRLAVESHASRRLSPPERPSLEAQTLWRAALQAARAHPEQLLAIAQLAQGWGYQAEAEETWWELASRPEHARNSLSALQNLYKAKQDTRGLLRVAKRALELNPNDLVAANNCASLGLLLNGDSTARRLALRLHNEHPNNRAFAATYAFALHSEGKRAEALRVIEKLKEEELHVPAIAAYYVVMLVENGKLERARAFLAHAERASLLPEERQLLANATRKLVSTGEKLAGM